MERAIPNHCAKVLLRYPILWGEDRLLAQATARRLIAATNVRLGQGPPVPPSKRPYGCAKAEVWLRYRCAWLFCRTSLRDVPPDVVLRLAPAELPGHYDIVERLQFRRDFRCLHELNDLVEDFHRRIRQDRNAAIFSTTPMAQDLRRRVAARPAAARRAGH